MSARKSKEAADELEKYLQLDPKAAADERIRGTIKELRGKQQELPGHPHRVPDWVSATARSLAPGVFQKKLQKEIARFLKKE